MYVAVDPSGNVFFTDGMFTEIRKVSPQGVISTFVGPLYSAPCDGAMPYSFTYLVADSAGNIYAVTSAYSSGPAIVRFNANANPTVIAGGVSGVNSSLDGPALPSNITPSWLSVAGNANIAFSDSFQVPYNAILEVREVTAQSMLVTLAGANPQPAPDGTPLNKAWFFSPSSLAFDPSGNLYIADFQACQIREISPAGVLSTFAGSGTCGYPAPSGNAKTADLVYPYSIAVDSNRNVWVADDFLNLYSIAQDGTISFFPTRTPVTGGKGWLAFDSQDNLYVAAMDSLVRILPDQTTQTVVPAPTGPGVPPPGFVQVNELGSDTSGGVYFASLFDFYAINANGSYTQVGQNSFGAPPDSLSPGLAVDKAGNFWQPSYAYIGASSPSGTALFGSGKTGASGDGGPAASAGFNSGGAAFSPSGALYLIDGNRIRVLTGSGPLQAPSIAQGGIVNAASYTGGAIAPGELLSIFGWNFGATALATNAPVNNSIPTALGRTRVLFNGQPGAITVVTPNQINAFVPNTYAVPPGSSAQVQVQVDDSLSLPVSVPVIDAAPGLFTASGTGSGQGSILNQDGSINSAANPAAPGSIISIFGTGEGATNPQLATGNLVLSTPYPTPVDTVSVTIGGQPAQVVYAGEAPTLPVGVFQINAQIPAGVTGNSVSLSVSVGTHSTGSQVTAAVR
jgi:uncharacterized protein (TIGR03437 family)